MRETSKRVVEEAGAAGTAGACMSCIDIKGREVISVQHPCGGEVIFMGESELLWYLREHMGLKGSDAACLLIECKYERKTVRIPAPETAEKGVRGARKSKKKKGGGGAG